ncbi:MAG: hypothetical protein QXS32_09075 [Candidatus Nezhaarchaeales archaeon]
MVTRWEIESSMYVKDLKEEQLKDLKLCPLTQDYCLLDRCAFARKYKYKDQEVKECSLISLLRLLLARRGR